MGPDGDAERVRLAELVAALSLAIDLGFGQPVQHVLRQCLIALRLAERLEMDVEERGTVYYTALLINVACHSDAHEQAKWFGDDIGLKSDKYAYEFGTMRAAAAGLRRIGAGNPPLLKGLPDDSCQCPHWGYVFAGQLTVRYPDHVEVLEPGDAYYMSPGHVPAATAGSEFVMFSPTAELRISEGHMAEAMQALQSQ